MSIGKLGLIKCGSNIQQCPTLAELTADATATASQIAEGATAYVQGEKITGTMPTTIDVAAAQIKFGYSSFEKVPSCFDFSALTNGTNMFTGCTGLTSLSGLNTPLLTDGTGMFNGCTGLTSLSGLNISSLINGYFMFNGCTGLTSLSGLNISSLINGYFMFNGCTGLTSLSGLNISSLINGYFMFNGCTGLTSLSGLNISSLTNGTGMFNDCTGLTYFKNLSTISCSLSFADSPLLNPSDAESSILGMLADLTGKISQTITFNTALQSSISESAIQAATDKNWVVNFADSM